MNDNIIINTDLLSCTFSFLAFGILIIKLKKKWSINFKSLVVFLTLISLLYYSLIAYKWIEHIKSLEPFEDLFGAVVPMFWAFLFYTYMQQVQALEIIKNEEYLRITLNSIGDGVISTDLKGNVLNLNPIAEFYTGYSFPEIAGKSIDSFFEIIDSQTRIKQLNPIEKVLLTGEKINMTNHTILKSKKGNEYHIATSASPILNENNTLIGVVLVFKDMTEKYKQEQLVRESENRLNLAIKGTKAGLWDWNIQTGEMVINERWAEIIGYTINDLKPTTITTWEKYLHPEDLEQAKRILNLHFEGKTDFFELEVRLKHKKGKWIWVMDRGMVVERDIDGKPLRMAGTHIDIDKQKKAELELKEQMEENIALNEEYLSQNEEISESLTRIQIINEELEKARKKAEDSDKLKSAFLANMSHEIRTPMNGIIGFSEMLEDPDITIEKRNQYSKIITQSSHQLLAILNDILDLSKIETGNMELYIEEVAINDLISDLLVFYEPQAKKKSLIMKEFKELKYNQSIILTDKTRLKQVLTNMISNALKFTENGSISFGYRKRDNELHFFVKDSGIGISPDMHQKIFEPFRQAEIGTTRKYGGTGLGLSISKKIIEMLGGCIWLESEPYVGTTFYFSIPYKCPETQSNKYDPNIDKIASLDQKLTILVAEDDDVNYMYIEELFSKSGFNLIHAQDGLEAIDLFKKNPQIQLVLMDIKMPHCNGYEAFKAIKAINPIVPVIAQTAYAMSEDKVKVSESGFEGYIAKPINKIELLNLMKELISEQEA